jgi:hypothetical protein
VGGASRRGWLDKMDCANTSGVWRDRVMRKAFRYRKAPRAYAGWPLPAADQHVVGTDGGSWVLRRQPSLCRSRSTVRVARRDAGLVQAGQNGPSAPDSKKYFPDDGDRIPSNVKHVLVRKK